ncbi:hypothetical protein MPSEU_000046000 [Mayamaea pseudoterrestris]|nr:hypothetical protein MPSEU_000046000 [Mayamaea pseudoterrestris]
MFRKPKRTAKTAFRRKDDEDDVNEPTNEFASSRAQDDDDDNDEPDTTELLAEARLNSSINKKLKSTASSSASTSGRKVLHTFDSSTATATSAKPSEKDLAVSTTSHHSVAALSNPAPESIGFGSDGVFRDSTRNKFHAGPLRAAASVRVTARFDYQPDVCKDYKQTGFCGYGDTCIYLHDRGDSLSGWQLEEQWQLQQKAKQQMQQQELDDYMKQQQRHGGAKMNTTTHSSDLQLDDGLPFACHLCRRAFDEPVVTNCAHYFCQACILRHVRETSEACPICSKDTHGVFNEPTKLLAKKRKLLGAHKAKENGSWKAFYQLFHAEQEDENDNDE